MDSHTDYEKEKKRARRNIVKVLLILGFIFLGLIGYGVYWLFFDWSRFKSEFIAESISPDGTYTVNAYVSNGGATTSYAVLGELVFNKENKRSRRIYWQYREENAVIEWIDDDTVIINDVQLEVPDEMYDYRSGIK